MPENASKPKVRRQTFTQRTIVRLYLEQGDKKNLKEIAHIMGYAGTEFVGRIINKWKKESHT